MIDPEKCIITTMIGAISVIEKSFEEDIKQNEEFREKFLQTRKAILDLGNNQIKLLRKGSGQ